MIKIARREITLPILLLLISFLLWKHIPSLQFVGEGFYYFSEHTVEFNLVDKIPHDLFARLLFATLPHWFGSSVHLYMWVQLVYMLFIDFLMYFLVRILTGSRLAGFLTAFLFSTSFIAKFDMFSAGGYQYFLQRGILLLFLLPALLFFILYFRREFLLKYYVLGLLFFLFGVSMGFFATWFLPIFIFYPIIYLLFNLKEVKKLFWKVIWVPFPFLIGNMLIIKQSIYIPPESIFDFIFNKFSYSVIGIIQQLTVLTFPLGELLLRVDKLSIEFFSILVIAIFFYCYAFFTNSKLQKQWKILQITALISALAMFMFNIYLNAAETLNTFRSTRYFYYPYVAIAIFWGISLAGMVNKRNKSFNIFLMTFFIAWFAYNNVHIQRRLALEEWVHKANKETVEILRSWAPETRKNPVFMYLPASLGGYGGQFAIQFFSHPDGKVAMQGLEPLDLNKLAEKGLSPKNLFVLLYDPVSKDVIDKTEESRVLLYKLEQNE